MTTQRTLPRILDLLAAIDPPSAVLVAQHIRDLEAELAEARAQVHDPGYCVHGVTTGVRCRACPSEVAVTKRPDEQVFTDSGRRAEGGHVMNQPTCVLLAPDGAVRLYVGDLDNAAECFEAGHEMVPVLWWRAAKEQGWAWTCGNHGVGSRRLCQHTYASWFAWRFWKDGKEPRS